jgi:predicted AlkP superfamily pyrophosphatase or phosphodiesterase
MNEVLRERARRYHAAIREAVMGKWDPIGVASMPEAADEYDSYIPAIYKLLIERKPVAEIFDYLWWLETEHMGLTGDRQATEAFAMRLTEIPSQLNAATPDSPPSTPRG